jgi:hypothetical protein
MSILKMAIGGIVAGLIGASVWAGIGYFTGLEIGWIAWLIGVLVGVGVRIVGSQDVAYFDKTQRRMVRSRVAAEGPLAGMVAAVLAVVSVLAGKYALVHLFLSAPAASLEGYLEDDAMISSMADQVVVEYEAQGRAVSWPAGVSPAEAYEREDYPPDVWADAENRWNALPEEEKAELKKAQAELIGAALDSVDGARSAVFLSSFGLFDLLWFGLAAATAFKLGASASA